jgi:hypothetical protein
MYTIVCVTCVINGSPNLKSSQVKYRFISRLYSINNIAVLSYDYRIIRLDGRPPGPTEATTATGGADHGCHHIDLFNFDINCIL